MEIIEGLYIAKAVTSMKSQLMCLQVAKNEQCERRVSLFTCANFAFSLHKKLHFLYTTTPRPIIMDSIQQHLAAATATAGIEQQYSISSNLHRYVQII